MKNLQIYLLLSFLILIGCKGKSQQTTTQATTAIDKTQITWQKDITQALAMASAQNKLLFVEVYLPTCPVCQSIEPFFKNPEIAGKYNSFFINYKLDGGIADQTKFINEKNILIPSFPQFLFFSADGNLVHQVEGSTDIASFLKTADVANDPTKRAESYQKRYLGGERGLDFLINYAAFGRITKDSTIIEKAQHDIFAIYPKDQLGSETSWKITKKCVTDIDNGFAQYWFKHVPQAAAFETKDGHKDAQFNIFQGIIQGSLFSSKGKKYSHAKLQEVKEYMRSANAGQFIDVAFWELETTALIREKKETQSLAIGQRMVDKFKANPQSLLYIIRIFNDQYPNATYAKNMSSWIANIKPEGLEPAIKAEYFYEKARFSNKLNDKKSAKAFALQAQTTAAQAQVDAKKFNDLMLSIGN